MAPVEIIEQATAEDLTAQSRRLQDKAQAPRLRYRGGIEQSAEGDEPALCFHSVAKCVRSVAAAASRRRASWLRMMPLRHQALAVRRLLVQWWPGRAVASQRWCKAVLSCGK